VLTDWLAWPLVGAEAESMTARSRAVFGDSAPLLATWVAARSRFTEDWLAGSRAVQYVILRAGLDTFAWRQTGRVRVFEVDHPATQDWKRSRLDALASPRLRNWCGRRWTSKPSRWPTGSAGPASAPATRSSAGWGLPALNIGNERVVLAVKRE
jgi:hypothetical protein